MEDQKENSITISEEFIARCKNSVWKDDEFFGSLWEHFTHPDGQEHFDLRLEEFQEFLSDVQIINWLRSI